MVENFKTQVRIFRTFFKTLELDNTLDFIITHHLEPGIRLYRAIISMLTSRKEHQPSNYFPIVEAEDTLCERSRLGNMFNLP